jgi:hypothetical protein
MSRALPGGMLNSKERTEYEDWLEKLHKEIDAIKPEKDTCSMPLMDSECGANGCHNYDGTLMTDKNRVHGVFEATYFDSLKDQIKSDLKKVKEHLVMACFLTTHLKEEGEDESVLAKRDEAISYELKEAEKILKDFQLNLNHNHADLVNVISQSFVYDFEDCLAKVCETIDKILKVNNAHKDVIMTSIKAIADEANELIKDLNREASQLTKLHELTLKNRDGSPFLGSFNNLYEFNKNVLGDKYAKVGDLKVAA